MADCAKGDYVVPRLVTGAESQLVPASGFSGHSLFPAIR
jgi:hypothetical protein